MPKVIFLPHKLLLPQGGTFFANVNDTILDVALRNNIKLEHVCERSCVCTTCHCIVRKGFSSLSLISDEEEDILDKAWGLELDSRLACQAKIKNEDIIVEIPYYSNHLVNN